MGSLSSQRVSDLLMDFGEQERNTFYRRWYKLIKEREYIALAITSLSSYSKQRDECEFGYNRDGEKLPQINLCMLFGEDSRLPIYQTTYTGSLGDVSTLQCTTAQFQSLFDDLRDVLVMDKGFYSASNIDYMLNQGIRFLLSVPFSNKFARQYVEDERLAIDTVENTIVTAGDPIRGVRRDLVWKDKVLHAHVFYDTVQGTKDRNDLFASIARLKTLVQSNAARKQDKDEIDRYLTVSDSEDGIAVTVRGEAVARALQTSGWFVLVSSEDESSQRAFDKYRLRDVVEKGFWKYKNGLGLERLRVHSDERAANKCFVAFVSLIISSHIRNIMRNNPRCDRLTVDRIFLSLAKIKSVVIGGRRILRPLTKQQKDLFQVFGVPLPVG